MIYTLALAVFFFLTGLSLFTGFPGMDAIIKIAALVAGIIVLVNLVRDDKPRTWL